MSKKILKEQNKDLEINVVDIVAKFDPSKTGKYTRFLVNSLKQKLEEVKTRRRGRGRIRTVEPTPNQLVGYQHPSGSNQLEDVIIDYLSEVYNRDNIENLYLFNEHLENNRIPQEKRDINQYKNWDEIAREVSLATIKQQQKLLEKEVLTVLNDNGWLVIRPLTFESSLTYGSGTRWCTASRNNGEYFYRYSTNGVLCYVINKNSGEKFGFYFDQNEQEFSIWNAPDKRIDSMESGIPFEILSTMFNYMKKEKTNFSYFSEQEQEKARKHTDYPEVVEEIAINEQFTYTDDTLVDEDVEPTTEEAIDLGRIVNLNRHNV